MKLPALPPSPYEVTVRCPWCRALVWEGILRVGEQPDEMNGAVASHEHAARPSPE